MLVTGHGLIFVSPVTLGARGEVIHKTKWSVTLEASIRSYNRGARLYQSRAEAQRGGNVPVM